MKLSEDLGEKFGCIGFILFCFVVWALLFGININGKHHGLSCASNGLTIE